VNIIAALHEEASKLESRLSAVRAAIGALDGTSGRKKATVETSKPPKTMSASVRRRIGAAVRARWQAKRSAEKTGTPKRRTMSAAGRRRIIEASKRRWAKYRAEKNGNAQPRRVMSAATKRKLSIAAKARWAARSK
jgi:hypothetical protein